MALAKMNRKPWKKREKQDSLLLIQIPYTIRADQRKKRLDEIKNRAIQGLKDGVLVVDPHEHVVFYGFRPRNIEVITRDASSV